jgi:hypothetical protein
MMTTKTVPAAAPLYAPLPTTSTQKLNIPCNHRNLHISIKITNNDKLSTTTLWAPSTKKRSKSSTTKVQTISQQSKINISTK